MLANVLSYLPYIERYRLISYSERFKQCMYLKCTTVKVKMGASSPAVFIPNTLSAKERKDIWVFIRENEYKHAKYMDIHMLKEGLGRISETLQFAPIVDHLRLSAPKGSVDSYGLQGPLQSLNFLDLKSLSLDLILKFYSKQQMNDWFNIYGEILLEFGINFDNAKDVMKEDFLDIIAKCQKLTKLTIMGDIGLEFLITLAKKLPQLKRLVIRSCPSLKANPIEYYTNIFPSIDFLFIECDESGNFIEEMPELELNFKQMKIFGDLIEGSRIKMKGCFFVYSRENDSIIISNMKWLSMKLPLNCKHVMWLTRNRNSIEVSLMAINLFQNNKIESLRVQKPINTVTEIFKRLTKDNPTQHYLYSQISFEPSKQFGNLVTNFLNPNVLNANEFGFIVNNLIEYQITYSDLFETCFSNLINM